MRSVTAEIEPDTLIVEVQLLPFAFVDIDHNAHARAWVILVQDSQQGRQYTDSVIVATQPSVDRVRLTNLTAITYALRVTISFRTFTVGASNEFQVDALGNLVRVNNVLLTWPAVQGLAGTVLSNDGAGNLSWGAGGGGGMSIGGAVGGGVPGNVLYVGPGSLLAQIANAAGTLTNDGAGNLSWSAAGSTASVRSTVYNCPAGVLVNDAVYVSGADAVDKADADDATKQPLVGLVVSKPTAVTCVVQYYGEFTGLGGLTPNATYFLSATPGQITTTAPSTAGNIVQRIGFARSATVLVLTVDRDFIELM